MKKECELYIHIPFCIKKCNYCDFLSFSADPKERDRYVDSLAEEITASGNLLREEKEKEGISREAGAVRSIFFGGGTPSLLSGEQMNKILSALRQSFLIKDLAEITVEANPGTLTEEKLAAYRELGINRLSIGLQSTDNQCLSILGRIHTREEFLQNYDLARKIGWDNINIDLMSSLPGQSLSSYEKTLRLVSELKPEHISSYSLILEEGTPFFKDPKIRAQLPDEETDREMYAMTKEILAKSGYERYEISNYALPGKECLHNLGYWSGIEYLGFGLGAASYFHGARFSNGKNFKKYIDRPFLPFSVREDYTELTQKEEMEEFMFLGLRKREGISKIDFSQKFGKSLEEIYGKVIYKYEEMGLLMWSKSGSMLRLTDAGIDVSDYIFCEFML